MTAPPRVPASAGLCARCIHGRAIVSGRGSLFVQCRLALEDPRFPRYPRLPVLACDGFAPANAPGASDPSG